MESLILFLVVYGTLWMVVEGLAALYKQYKQYNQYNQYKEPEAEFPEDFFEIIDPRSADRWGLPTKGKPATQRGCKVCGCWTPRDTCSECVTRAEVEAIDGYKPLTKEK